MQKDTIQLQGIRAFGYTGALPEENVLGQWFRADLTLWIDLSVAGQSDNLNDTYDYRQIIQATQRLIRAETFRLIERLAEKIATDALASDSRLTQVSVKLTKLSPPIPDFDGQIAVEILRTRP